jgi:hypothetical protein
LVVRGRRRHHRGAAGHPRPGDAEVDRCDTVIAVEEFDPTAVTGCDHEIASAARHPQRRHGDVRVEVEPDLPAVDALADRDIAVFPHPPAVQTVG